MINGKFITIEGIEGAGKSTAVNFIRDYLIKENINFFLTREPGGTPFAEAIRELLLHKKHNETIAPLTELLLMFASRAQLINQVILPKLQSGTWVISDRFVDASYAYQNGGREIDVKQIEILDKLVVGELYPHLTFLLDLPPELGLQRTELRGNQKDRIEQEKVDFFRRVREVYLARAKENPKRFKMIDATQSINEVKAQIQHYLTLFLSGKK